MNFVSYGFVVLFAVALLARLTLGRDSRSTPYLTILLVLSLTFYAWHLPYYLPILLASCIVDFWAAIWIDRCPPESRERKWAIALSCVFNLGLLGFFKYHDFFIASVNESLTDMGLSRTSLEPLGLLLPMGISFYTFASMSYTIDVYRGELKPERTFWKFLLFVAFFPHLVAGPILRASDFLYQYRLKRGVRAEAVTEGLYLIVYGFFLKMVLADNLARPVNYYWPQAVRGDTDSVVALVTVTLFWCQVYCDFAGYSNIARGLAYLFGFRFPLNFQAPFVGTSLSDLWRRWHMTLGNWLRDYVYVSFGGNRGTKARVAFNLVTTMGLSGLWHGAAWTYVVWGFAHGLFLAAERELGLARLQNKLGAFGWAVFVQLFFLFSLVVFRSATLGDAGIFYGTIARGTFEGIKDPGLFASLAALGPLALIHLRTLATERSWLPPLAGMEKALASAGMLYMTITCFGGVSDFIYFQF